MLLAADVGGTKTLLGLFARAPDRPATIEVGEFVTLDYDGLVPMIREFLKAERRRGARDRRRRRSASPGRSPTRSRGSPTCPGSSTARRSPKAAALRHVHILNDLEAMAHSVAVLEPDELRVLQHGVSAARTATRR